MAYTQEQKETIFNTIFETIENGKSLRYALSQIPLSSKTFYEWIEEDEEKVKQYARATEERAEAILDEMIDIVDDSSNDVDEFEIIEGIVSTRTNNEVVQRSRLRYDARKWLVSKLNPKKYGDKLDVTTDGEKINHTPIFGDNPLDKKE